MLQQQRHFLIEKESYFLTLENVSAASWLTVLRLDLALITWAEAYYLKLYLQPLAQYLRIIL